MTNYWFISTKYRQGSYFALFTFALAFIVILLGAYTRLTNAGLSCPDWPHCYGYLTAPHTDAQIQQATLTYPSTPVDIKKAWTEMTHRYVAGTEGILIVILACSILFSRTAKTVKAKSVAIILMALLCLQVALGMLTVTEKLKPIIVLAHLLTGLGLLSLLWWAYLTLYLYAAPPASLAPTKRLLPWCWLALGIVVAQITLGGWVSTHYAGLACIDFPYCNGNLLPNIQWQALHTDLISIHMLHRIGAFITAVYLAWFAYRLWQQRAFKTIAFCLFALVSLQLTLGILTIIWLRPVWIALIHHTVAIFLLLTLITTLIKTFLLTDQQHGTWIA